MIILSHLNTGVWISRDLYDDFDYEVVKLARKYGMSDRADVQNVKSALLYLNSEIMSGYRLIIDPTGLICLQVVDTDELIYSPDKPLKLRKK